MRSALALVLGSQLLLPAASAAQAPPDADKVVLGVVVKDKKDLAVPDLKPEEFEVLAVNVDEDRETALAFAGSPGFPVLLDSNSKVTMTWPIKGLPTSFLIDPQGRLAFSLAGEQEFDGPEVVAAIRGLLQP